MWLVDLERTVALLVGRCLGGMLQGSPTSLEEQDTAYWLKTPLFSNGLEVDIPQLGRGADRDAFTRLLRFCVLHIDVFLLLTPCWRPADSSISSLLEAALSGDEEQKPLDSTLRPDLSVLVDLALCSTKEPANSLWINMQDYGMSKGPLSCAETVNLVFSGLRRPDPQLAVLCVLLQTGTTRLSATRACWTPCPALCWRPC